MKTPLTRVGHAFGAIFAGALIVITLSAAAAGVVELWKLVLN